MNDAATSIRYEVADAIATITLNRPAKRNAMDQAMLYALVDHVVAAERDDNVKAVVLQAEGPMFCSGFDLSGPDKFFGDGDGHRSAIAAMRESFAAEPALVAATGVLMPVCGAGPQARFFEWFQRYGSSKRARELHRSYHCHCGRCRYWRNVYIFDRGRRRWCPVCH